MIGKPYPHTYVTLGDSRDTTKTQFGHAAITVNARGERHTVCGTRENTSTYSNSPSPFSYYFYYSLALNAKLRSSIIIHQHSSSILVITKAAVKDSFRFRFIQARYLNEAHFRISVIHCTLMLLNQMKTCIVTI